MSDKPIQLDYDWEKHNIGDDLNGKYVDMKKIKFTIRDLFNHKDLGDTSKHLQSVIESHDVLMVKLDKKN